jgi:hypothetical protein
MNRVPAHLEAAGRHVGLPRALSRALTVRENAYENSHPVGAMVAVLCSGLAARAQPRTMASIG